MTKKILTALASSMLLITLAQKEFFYNKYCEGKSPSTTNVFRSSENGKAGAEAQGKFCSNRA